MRFIRIFADDNHKTILIMKKVLSILLMLMFISAGASAAVKCKAVTAKGTQCTRNAKKDGYCTQHYKMNNDNQSVKLLYGTQCRDKTSSGNRCSRKSYKDGLCKQHYENSNMKTYLR